MTTQPCSVHPSGSASAITDSQLWDAYRWPESADRPWLRANLVVTVDGAFRDAGGSSRGISSAADRRLLLMLRSGSDVVLVGGQTARSEGYRPLRVPVEWSARRAGEGRFASPHLAVVTRTGEVPTGLAIATDVTLFRSEESDVDVPLDGLVETLAKLGWTRILCEGGPNLVRSLMARNLIDEACVTVTPSPTGPQPSAATAAAAAAHYVPAVDRFRLVGLLGDHGTHFTRWQRPT